MPLPVLDAIREHRPFLLADDPGQEVRHESAVERAHLQAAIAQLRILLAIGDLDDDRARQAAGVLDRIILAGREDETADRPGRPRGRIVAQAASCGPVAGILQQPHDVGVPGRLRLVIVDEEGQSRW